MDWALIAFTIAMIMASLHYVREFVSRERRMKQLRREIARAGELRPHEFRTTRSSLNSHGARR